MNYADIKRKLAEPLPREMISTREQAGATIPYISVSDAKQLLDDRAGVWSSSVKEMMVVGDELVMVVTLNIFADDGIFSQDGTGYEKLNVSGWGDTSSNSFAMALKRAAESHGLGRELYRKDHAHGAQPQVANADLPNLHCNCGLQVKEITGTSKNGKPYCFYACPKPKSESCGFKMWDSDVPAEAWQRAVSDKDIMAALNILGKDEDWLNGLVGRKWGTLVGTDWSDLPQDKKIEVFAGLSKQIDKRAQEQENVF